MATYIAIDDVIEINRLILGSESAQLRDRAVLEGALGRPTSGFGGTEQFPDVWSKAAALLSGIASTQAFIDGNKRTAWAVAEAFLNLNGIGLGDIPTVEAEVFVLAVAASVVDIEAIARWFQSRTAETAARVFGLAPRTTAPSEIHGGTVRLASLSETGAQIRGLIARGVTFLGPAVLIAGQGTRIAKCTWDTANGGIEAIIWDVDGTSRQVVVGAIALIDCDFEDCTFVGVGYAADQDGVQRFLESMNV